MGHLSQCHYSSHPLAVVSQPPRNGMLDWGPGPPTVVGQEGMTPGFLILRPQEERWFVSVLWWGGCLILSMESFQACRCCPSWGPQVPPEARQGQGQGVCGTQNHLELCRHQPAFPLPKSIPEKPEVEIFTGNLPLS